MLLPEMATRPQPGEFQRQAEHSDLSQFCICIPAREWLDFSISLSAVPFVKIVKIK